MYILTRAEPLENCKENIYRIHDAELEAKYPVGNYQRHERGYLIKDSHKVYTVICPAYIKSVGRDTVVICSMRLYPLQQYSIRLRHQAK